MTVEELIAELQKRPPTDKVWIEGCDCFGEASGVEPDAPGETLITRDR